MASDAQPLALLLSPNFVQIAPYVAVPKLHQFSHLFSYYRACQCAGFSDGEGVETLWSSLDPTATPTRVNEPSARHEALDDHRNLWTECREHGELAPAFDWAFQCPLHMYIDNLEDDDDDEMPGLMSQDESDSFKTNRVRGFKPRNLSKL